MRELAGDHETWFLEEAGNWAGYYSIGGVAPHHRPLVEAILAIPGTEAAVELGRREQRSYTPSPTEQREGRGRAHDQRHDPTRAA